MECGITDLGEETTTPLLHLLLLLWVLRIFLGGGNICGGDGVGIQHSSLSLAQDVEDKDSSGYMSSSFGLWLGLVLPGEGDES